MTTKILIPAFKQENIQRALDKINANSSGRFKAVYKDDPEPDGIIEFISVELTFNDNDISELFYLGQFYGQLTH